MKSTFIFALLALGTLICATKAAPSSSEMQQDDGDMKKLLELIDRAARSQQEYYDGEEDSNANLQDAEELSEEQGGENTNTKKLLELIDHAAKSQQYSVQGEDMDADVQSFWNTVKSVWNFYKRHRRTIHYVARHIYGRRHGRRGYRKGRRQRG